LISNALLFAQVAHGLGFHAKSMMAPKEKRAEKSAMTVATIFRPRQSNNCPKGPDLAVHFHVAEHQPLDAAKKVLGLRQA